MTISLHALTALMLADLSLTTLFEITHSFYVGLVFCGFFRPQFREICEFKRRFY